MEKELSLDPGSEEKKSARTKSRRSSKHQEKPKEPAKRNTVVIEEAPPVDFNLDEMKKHSKTVKEKRDGSPADASKGVRIV